MGSGHINVLLVEDIGVYAEFVEHILTRDDRGFEVQIVSCLHDALAMLKQQPFDAVVLDLKLPDTTGSEGVSQLYAAFPDIPIIVCSGKRDQNTIRKALERGAEEYLVKETSTPHVLPVVIVNAVERKRVAAKLAESERLYSVLFESTPIGSGLATLDGEILIVNSAFAHMLGTTPEELRGQRVADQYADPADRNDLLKEVESEGTVQGFETRLRKKDGGAIDVRLSVTLVEMDGKRYLQTACEDITKEKAAVASLRESEERYRELFDGSRDGFVLLDRRGRFLNANQTFCDMVGYTLAELRNSDGIFSITPDRWHQWQRRKIYFERLLRKGYSGIYEKEYVRKDGSTISVEVQAYAHFDAEGSVEYFWGVVRDITDRKEVEEERTRLMSAIQHTAEMVLISDSDAVIQYVNPAFEHVTGYSRKEAIGQTPRIVKSGRQDEAFYEQLWGTLTKGQTWQGRLVNKRKDGTLYNEEMTITPIQDDRGTITNYVAVKRDVTRLLELESQLRQSQKLDAIGTLAGGVAHEINNPIMGIMSYAQLVKDELPEDSSLVEFVDGIMEETERVASIVRNLLGFARHERPGQAHQFTNIGSIVEASLSLTRVLLRHDQIHVDVDVNDDLSVRIRPQEIQQVLMNLLNNARDALNRKFPGPHDDKRICICARPIAKAGKDYVRTTIADSGPGVDPQIEERIFEPFFTTKSRDRATGLGLSTSYGIVAEHGGEILFDRTADGMTQFHIDLPFVNKDDDPLAYSS